MRLIAFITDPEVGQIRASRNRGIGGSMAGGRVRAQVLLELCRSSYSVGATRRPVERTPCSRQIHSGSFDNRGFPGIILL